MNLNAKSTHFIECLKQYFLQSWRDLLSFVLMLSIVEYLHLMCFGYDAKTAVDHLLSVITDTVLLIFICNCLTFFYKKAANILAATILSLWIIANVVYFRFFQQYLSFSCIQEVSNFAGDWWFGYVDKAFRWADLFVLATYIIIISLNVKGQKKKTNVWGISIGLLTVLLLFHCIFPLKRSIQGHFKFEAVNLDKCILYYDISQTQLIYQYGIFRSQMYYNIKYFNPSIVLSNRDVQEIEQFIEKRRVTNNDSNVSIAGKNIVFVLVESFLSVVINQKIDNEEITPFINSLVKDEGTFFNPNLQQNICSGESSDGQFIYMTGLLPLRSRITVTDCLRRDVIALPAILRDSLHYSTAMTIPTGKEFYHQNEINYKYGIDSLATSINYYEEGRGSDEKVFYVAEKLDKRLKQPFFHIILTMSMHAPYGNRAEYIKWAPKFPVNYSKEYSNYLCQCHYMDEQLQLYVEHLKKDGLWENTVLVLVSDHEAHDNMLNMKRSALQNSKIPFVIVNAGINYKLEENLMANQIDVYPTLLYLLRRTNRWNGLGFALVSGSYQSYSADESLYKLSEKILCGDYLKSYK